MSVPQPDEPRPRVKQERIPYFFLAAVSMLFLQRIAKLWNGPFFGPNLYDELAIAGAVLAVVSLLLRERLWLLSAIILTANLFILSLKFW
ncbi:hypothetical protein [Lysobacter sp. Root690]|uniref:hypothetical protein n=1 Tax=Lysobacter sp. Root690 TaxID=1736588 RepID=UPI0006F31C68|nr:hypothetical protein [Lysobacter sp. Root690]KRB02622.1 hypothetical protein ASD86_24325 [Lysobacter sp. Root690]